MNTISEMKIGNKIIYLIDAYKNDGLYQATGRINRKLQEMDTDSE